MQTENSHFGTQTQQRENSAQTINTSSLFPIYTLVGPPADPVWYSFLITGIFTLLFGVVVVKPCFTCQVVVLGIPIISHLCKGIIIWCGCDSGTLMPHQFLPG